MDAPYLESKAPPGEKVSRLLVLVDGTLGCAELLRAAHRLAQVHGAAWMAVSVESPGRIVYSRLEEERLSENLRLAERLGAEVLALQASGVQPAQTLRDLAKVRGITGVVIPKAPGPFQILGQLRQGLLWAGLPGVAVHWVPLEPGLRPRSSEPGEPGRRRAGLPITAVVLATLLCFILSRYLDLADLVMIYMLGITGVAALFGRGAGLLASVLSVAALDFFFISPRLSFNVSDVRHVGTFGIMLAVGWVVANLAERIRAQARISMERERHSSALFRLGKVLAEGGEIQALRGRIEAYLAQELGLPTTLWLCDGAGQLTLASPESPPRDPQEGAIAQWALQARTPAGHGTNVLPAARSRFYPLLGSERSVGVLRLESIPESFFQEADRDGLLRAFASQISMALERAWLAEERSEARIRAEQEKLKNVLLSGVSHDLRTPLATITGATSTLLEPGPECREEDQRALLESVHGEACRLQRLVNNLLDLTRIQSGQLAVRKEWIPVEEVVGAALGHLEEILAGRSVEVSLPDVWVPLDPVLFEQVLVNLLDNACKFSPHGSSIQIRAWADARQLTVVIRDHGPGIVPGEEEKIFEKLYRGHGANLAPGAGLGLAICRSILVAHGGSISADPIQGQGAQMTIRLPLDAPPPELLADLHEAAES